MFAKPFVFVAFLCVVHGEGSNRIIGGQNALEGQFPYQVSLRLNNYHFCGGTIIGSKTIVTAAHCKIGNVNEATAVGGTTTLDSGGESRDVKEFIQHPEWNMSTLENDIAVIILETAFTFNELIQPIPLSEYNIVDEMPVVASGWGFTTYPGNTPNDLQWIDLKTITEERCRELHAGHLFDSQICTLTKEGEGVCSGDSGGPLTLNNELVGVVSAAYLCALGLPDFFTRIYSFREWIIENSAN